MKLLLLLALTGCAQVTSLNMRKHTFGTVPSKIIWFQVAGLQNEHVAMLRFRENGERLTAFEQSVCMGDAWAYNLYHVRTSAQASFLAQITGKKNIKSSCEDADLRPVWAYLGTRGYTSGVLEVGANAKQSLTAFNQCGDNGKSFLSGLSYWASGETPANAKPFYYAEQIDLKPNQQFFDRSCNKGVCTSSIVDNVKGIHSRFEHNSNKNLFIIRDFTYLAALERKDFIKARDILADLERSYAYAMTLSRSSNDYLVMLSTGDSRFIDMPDQGKQWFEFEKSGINASAKRATLTNLVFASGARAENLCGIYEDADVFERMLSGPKQQGLELKLINPFK